PDEDVEIPVVVGDLRLGPKTRLLALDRIELDEFRYWDGVLPHLVVGAPVEHHRLGGPDGLRAGGSGGTGSRTIGRCGEPGFLDLKQQECSGKDQHHTPRARDLPMGYAQYEKRCVWDSGSASADQAAVSGGAQADAASEEIGEMALVREAVGGRDRGERSLRGAELLHGALQPAPPHVLAHGAAEAATKAPGERHRMDAHGERHPGDAERRAE